MTAGIHIVLLFVDPRALLHYTVVIKPVRAARHSDPAGPAGTISGLYCSGVIRKIPFSAHIKESDLNSTVGAEIILPVEELRPCILELGFSVRPLKMPSIGFLIEKLRQKDRFVDLIAVLVHIKLVTLDPFISGHLAARLKVFFADPAVVRHMAVLVKVILLSSKRKPPCLLYTGFVKAISADTFLESGLQIAESGRAYRCTVLVMHSVRTDRLHRGLD